MEEPKKIEVKITRYEQAINSLGFYEAWTVPVRQSRYFLTEKQAVEAAEFLDKLVLEE